jgi:hypothetical protein
VHVEYCWRRTPQGSFEILFGTIWWFFTIPNSYCLDLMIPTDYVAITDKAFEEILLSPMLGIGYPPCWDISVQGETATTIFRLGRPSCVSDPYHWINWPTNDNVYCGVRPCADNPLNICWMISTYCWSTGEDGWTPGLHQLTNEQDPMSSSLCPDKFMPTDIYPGSTDGPIINCNPICD